MFRGEPLSMVPGHQWRYRPTIDARIQGREDPNPSGRCQCGCGEPVPVSTRTYSTAGYFKGKHARFLPGHWVKLKHRLRRQEELLRQPQARRLCITCYESRPLVAYLDTSGVCVVCVCRQQKVAEVDHRLLAAGC
jgi:hypothetical protein